MSLPPCCRVILPPTLLAMVLLQTSSAPADTLFATRRQPLREISHDVELRIVDGVARYRVRRSFANTGTQHEQVELGVALPYGAAVVGLRIRGRDRWYDGELLEAERAEKLYRELTGVGPHKPRDPALMRWRWANEAELYVFPVAPGKTSTVEYTLVAPLRYQRGHYQLSYPKAGSALLLAEPVLRIHPDSTGAEIRVGGQLAAAGQPVILSRPAPPPGSAGASSAAGRIERTLLADRGSSHALSRINVNSKATVQSIGVDVDLRHTYRGDLRVELVTPTGERHVLHSREGGSDNDLRSHYVVKPTVVKPTVVKPTVVKPTVVKPSKAIAASGTWRLHVSDHARYDVGTLDSWTLTLKLADGHELRQSARDTPRFIPDAPGGTNADSGLVTIRVTPAPISLFAARYGRAIAGPHKHFARFEVDVAPQLAKLPRKASVVFVVDASHSVGERGLRAQLDVLLAFLSHIPDAQAEIVLYRRRARRLFSRFVAAPEVLAALTRAQRDGALKLGNGSALEGGVALATQLLKERSGPRFAVLSTDTLLRPRWHIKDGLEPLARLPKDVVVHVALPKLDGAPTARDRRDDAHALAPLAAKHNGVLLHISGLPSQKSSSLTRVVLGLVRPVRLDDFQVVGEVLGVATPAQLAEGAGRREFVTLPKTPRGIEISAKLWARTIRRRIGTTPPFDRATAAFVFSLDRHRALDRKQMLRLARFGRVVSPVTSYLAIEPGVRPSRVGLERGRGGGSGMGYGSGSGRLGGRRGWRSRPSLQHLVTPLVQRCQKAHPAAVGWQLSLRVETTYHEIVDVQAGTKKPSALDRCVIEGVWSLALERHAFWQRRASFVMHLL